MTLDTIESAEMVREVRQVHGDSAYPDAKVTSDVAIRSCSNCVKVLASTHDPCPRNTNQSAFSGCRARSWRGHEICTAKSAPDKHASANGPGRAACLVVSTLFDSSHAFAQAVSYYDVLMAGKKQLLEDWGLYRELGIRLQRHEGLDSAAEVSTLYSKIIEDISMLDKVCSVIPILEYELRTH